MQRTVKGMRVNLAKMEFVNGNITVTDTKTETYANLDENTAIKRATKANIGYGVVSVESFKKLYKLDDEIFFKYAVECPTKDATENDN